MLNHTPLKSPQGDNRIYSPLEGGQGDVFIQHVTPSPPSSYTPLRTTRYEQLVMKKLILALALLGASASYAQDVFIPDQNFLNALVSAGVDSNTDSIIQQSEAQVVTQISINSKDIKDLTGIEEFTSLKRLYCANNDLDNLDVTNNLTLTNLSCERNNLMSLDVTENSQLEILDCSDNSIDSLDIAQNPKLLSLKCGDNSIYTLDITQNPKLAVLSSIGNSLSVLDLSQNIKLYELDCQSNNLSALDLSNNPTLSILYCTGNSLFSLDLTNNTALTDLNCAQNSLSILDLSNNPALIWLNCSINNLTSLNLSNQLSLQVFYCHRNNLGSLDLSNKLALTRLWCHDNPSLTCLPYLANGITSLQIPDQLTCLPNIPTSYSNKSIRPLCNPTNNSNNCESFPIIQGNIYNDLNSDLVFNNDDNPRAGAAILLEPSNAMFFSNANGDYSFSVQSLDTFSISVTSPYFEAVPSSYEVIFTSYDDISDTTIALQPKEIANSLLINIVNHSRARPGFPMRYYVSYQNQGTTTLDAELEFEMPSEFILDDTTSRPSEGGSTLTYNLGALTPGASGTIVVAGKIPVTATLSTVQMIYTSIEDVALGTEETPEDNIDSATYIITGSYDPNDKAGPATISPNQVSNQDPIDYFIRFQNTGTDTAFTVVVSDVIDQQLDISSVSGIQTSHLSNTFTNADTVYFVFHDILLPDSNTNEPASHGYIHFSIEPKTTLMTGDTIKNTANIYFDYNAPVITNTVNTVVYEPSIITSVNTIDAASISVFPIPAIANEALTLSGEHLEAADLYDLNGRLVQRLKLDHNQVQLNGIESGNYYLRITNAEGSVLKRIVVR